MAELPKPDPENSGNSPKRQKRGVPEGLWLRCDGCKTTVYRKQVEANLFCCPECGHHFYVPANDRIRQLLDEDSFEEWFADLASCDPLGFVDKRPYTDRLERGTEADGPEGGVHRRQRIHARPPLVLRPDRFGVHHGEHGFGRRREADARHRRGHRTETAAGDRQRLGRRSTDARRDFVADADGQSLRRAGPLSRRRRACSSRC